MTRLTEILEAFIKNLNPVPSDAFLVTESVDLARTQAEQAIIEWADNRTDKVDRLEVIDDTGRAYVRGSIYGTPISVKLDYQDDNRTLKVFVTPSLEKE